MNGRYAPFCEYVSSFGGRRSVDECNIDNLAAELQADLSFSNDQSLVIADLTYNSDCGTTEAICGMDVVGELNLNVAGSLTQSAAVIVGGNATLTATQEICLTGGDCTGDLLNDNDFQGTVVATGSTVEIVDANDLTTGAINATDDIYLRAGDNGVGGLTLTDNLNTTDAAGQVLLQADNGVSQTGGVITTNDLLLGGDDADEGSRNFTLNQANLVTNLATELQNGLELTNAQSIVVADLNYSSICGTTEAICGLAIGNDLALNITGS